MGLALSSSIYKAKGSGVEAETYRMPATGSRVGWGRRAEAQGLGSLCEKEGGAQERTVENTERR